MLLPVYILTAGTAAGLCGAFGRMILADQGFVPGFESGIALAVAIAAAYLSLQFAWMALLQLLYPTRANAPVFLEALSQLAAVAFLPYLAGITVPLPHETLYEIEPLLYLALFLVIHTLVKLVAFFAMTQAEPAVRWRMLFWAAACVATGLFARESFFRWQTALSAPRIAPAAAAAPVRSGEVFAQARSLREGIVLAFPVDRAQGGRLTFRWADPEQEADARLGTVYVTVQPQGAATGSWTEQVELKPQGWTAMDIPLASIPEGVTDLQILWSQKPEPAWVSQTGLRPLSDSTRAVLVSGPWRHADREATGVPNMLVIAVDALAADRVTSLGYERETTPHFDTFSTATLRFDNAFTPAPEARAAYMSLLTGLDPLSHGYLGRYRGLLPERVDTLPEVLQARGYSTAAFTEGGSTTDPDLTGTSEFARGFELFDDTYRVHYPGGNRLPGSGVQPEPAGAQITLEKALRWVEQQENAPWFGFVRLRELAHPMQLERYGERVYGSPSNPATSDLYDTALGWMDGQIGAFLERLQDTGRLDNTCVVITSPYGLEFERGGTQPGTATLSEASLRIPLALRLPDTTGRRRTNLAGLEDVAPTLLGIIGAEFSHPVSGVSLTRFGGTAERVAVNGDPVVLSVRDHQWRFTWLSGRNPFSDEYVAGATPLALYSVDLRPGESPLDRVRERPDLVAKYTEYLQDWLRQHGPPANNPAPAVTP